MKQLGLPPARIPVHVFVFDEVRLWRRTLSRSLLRPDGLAFHSRNEVFLLREPGQDPALEIFHEIVHVVLRQQHGESLPLWLEEGAAEYFGWKWAGEWYKKKGRTLTRSLPSLPADQLFAVEGLTGRTAYPARLEMNRVFYRQSAALVEALTERIGRGDMGLFMSLVCEAGGAWQAVLRDRFRWHQADFEQLDASMRIKALGHGEKEN